MPRLCERILKNFPKGIGLCCSNCARCKGAIFKFLCQLADLIPAVTPTAGSGRGMQANSNLELLLHRLQARGSPHAAILEHVPTQLPSQAARAVAVATQATQQAQVPALADVLPFMPMALFDPVSSSCLNSS